MMNRILLGYILAGKPFRGFQFSIHTQKHNNNEYNRGNGNEWSHNSHLVIFQINRNFHPHIIHKITGVMFGMFIITGNYDINIIM